MFLIHSLMNLVISYSLTGDRLQYSLYSITFIAQEII